MDGIVGVCSCMSDGGVVEFGFVREYVVCYFKLNGGCDGSFGEFVNCGGFIKCFVENECKSIGYGRGVED